MVEKCKVTGIKTQITAIELEYEDGRKDTINVDHFVFGTRFADLNIGDKVTLSKIGDFSKKYKMEKQGEQK